jgi:hypothetical protein|tara:strand:- start:35 stop:223 length:189 start_codon:yes stop_codon:yes gene_type:complete
VVAGLGCATAAELTGLAAGGLVICDGGVGIRCVVCDNDGGDDDDDDERGVLGRIPRACTDAR